MGAFRERFNALPRNDPKAALALAREMAKAGALTCQTCQALRLMQDEDEAMDWLEDELEKLPVVGEPAI